MMSYFTSMKMNGTDEMGPSSPSKFFSDFCTDPILWTCLCVMYSLIFLIHEALSNQFNQCNNISNEIYFEMNALCFPQGYLTPFDNPDSQQLRDLVALIQSQRNRHMKVDFLTVYY